MAGWTTDPTTAAEIASAVAGSADQITQLNALASALGTGSRTLTIKHAASGDPWAGTTVYQATLTGANVVLAGKLRPGTVTAQGVATATNMASGSAVLRVSNAAGRYVQASLSIGGSTGFRIPSSPAGIFSLVLGADFGFAADPALAPAPDIQLATITLRKETAGTQAGGFVTHTVGVPLKQGQIPAGTYPHFKIPGGVECPATVYAISSWPDGSMKFCGALLRIPQSVGGNGTLALEVRSGGNAPAAGTRSLSEISAQDLKIEIVGVDGLVGTWTCSVNAAVAANEDVVRIAHGPAGSIWKVSDHFRDSGGVAHGQLYGDFWIQLLTGADGNLLGSRFLPRISQPFPDQATPAPRHRDVTGSIKSGATLLRALQGHKDSETVGSTIRIPHGAGPILAAESGMFDYLQAGGSAAADCAVRVTSDAAYGIETRVLPPYVLTGTPEATSVSYYPMGRASMLRGFGTTGGRDDLGVFPLWAVQYMANQSANNEKVLRANALASSGWRQRYRRLGTRRVPAVVDIKTSYAGLGVIQTGWTANADSSVGIINASPNASLWSEDIAHPPNPAAMAYIATAEPQYLDLMIERAAYCIAQVPAGGSTWGTTVPRTNLLDGAWSGSRNVRVSAGGTVYKGSGVAFIGGGIRQTAWSMRDIAEPAGIAPDVAPDGSAVREYLRDVLASAHSALLAYTSAFPSTFGRDGLFFTTDTDAVGDGYYDSPWMQGYVSMAYCRQADLLADSLSAAARNYYSKKWVALGQIGDPGNMVAYRQNCWPGPSRHLAMTAGEVLTMGRRQLQFTAATSRISILAYRVNDTGDWTATNGDKFAFSVPQLGFNPYPSVPDHTTLYAVNCSGQTFQLALSPGGEPLVVPADILIEEFLVQLQNMAIGSFAGQDPTYRRIFRGLIAYHKLRGDDMGDLLSRYDAKTAAAGNVDMSVLGPFNFKDA